LKTAIVTGATGFVGVHLVAELLSSGVEVTALCRKESPNLDRLPGQVEIVYDMDQLPEADVFYHLAWDGASGPGRADAVLQSSNVKLTLGALAAAHRSGAKFVALGTVYERFYEQVIMSGEYRSSDFYILSKSYAHSISNQMAYKLGCSFVWCQVCHPIGRLIKPEQLIAYTVSSLVSRDAPSYGPAENLFDIVAVEDVAKALLLIGKQNTPRREYYIGSGAPCLLRDYLERAKQILDVPTPLLIGKRPDDGYVFDRGWLDITPLSEDTGFAPVISFEQAVQNVESWLKEC